MEENKNYNNTNSELETTAFVKNDIVVIDNQPVSVIDITFNKKQFEDLLNNREKQNNDYINLFIYNKNENKNFIFLVKNTLDYEKNKEFTYQTKVNISREKLEKIVPYKGEKDEYVNLTLFPNNYKQKSLDRDYNVMYGKEVIGKADNAIKLHSWIELAKDKQNNEFYKADLDVDFFKKQKEFFINKNSTKKTVYITDKPTQHTNVACSILRNDADITALAKKSKEKTTISVNIFSSKKVKDEYILIHYKDDGIGVDVGKGKVTTSEKYLKEFNESISQKAEENQEKKNNITKSHR